MAPLLFVAFVAFVSVGCSHGMQQQQQQQQPSPFRASPTTTPPVLRDVRTWSGPGNVAVTDPILAAQSLREQMSYVVRETAAGAAAYAAFQLAQGFVPQTDERAEEEARQCVVRVRVHGVCWVLSQPHT
jgi:hypothetical protein